MLFLWFYIYYFNSLQSLFKMHETINTYIYTKNLLPAQFLLKLWKLKVEHIGAPRQSWPVYAHKVDRLSGPQREGPEWGMLYSTLPVWYYRDNKTNKSANRPKYSICYPYSLRERKYKMWKQQFCHGAKLYYYVVHGQCRLRMCILNHSSICFHLKCWGSN